QAVERPGPGIEATDREHMAMRAGNLAGAFERMGCDFAVKNPGADLVDEFLGPAEDAIELVRREDVESAPVRVAGGSERAFELAGAFGGGGGIEDFQVFEFEDAVMSVGGGAGIGFGFGEVPSRRESVEL